MILKHGMVNAPTPWIKLQTFQRIPKDERRFKIDPRFKAVLTDDRFRAVDGAYCGCVGARMCVLVCVMSASWRYEPADPADDYRVIKTQYTQPYIYQPLSSPRPPTPHNTGQYDKYGRKLRKDRRVVDDLSAFYTVDDEEESAEAAEAGGGKVKGKKGKGGGVGDGDPRFRLKAGMGGPAEEEDEEEDSGSGSGSEAGGEKEKPAESRSEMEERLDYLNRLARGDAGSDASVSTSSSSSGDSGSDGDEDSDSEGEEGEGGVAESRRLEAGPVPMGEATRRLAIMNVDWDHMKAVDLLGVLLSFKPAAGRVARVTVYCSDYGLERMAEEARLGPGFLRGGAVAAAASGGSKEEEGEGGDEEGSDASSSAASGGGSGDEGEEVDQEALRAYEIQRLRYHFAVAECDAVGTAAALYEEVDGLEFEASAAQLDARFVPDDVGFEGRPVRDTAEALPSDYGAWVGVWVWG